MMRLTAKPGHIGRSIVCCVLITLPAIFGVIKPAEAIDKAFPFVPGEKLTFQLRWGLIPAGQAVLEVLPMATIDGMESYHFMLTAKSSPFIDLFFKVRDQIDAYTNLAMTHSLLYRKRQQEGKTRRDVLVRFDWKKKEAQYSNFKKNRDPISVIPGTFDPLSVFYYARLLDWKSESLFERPVTDGKRCVLGKARVIRIERIELPGGTYDTFLIKPELRHIRGVFEKSKDAEIKIWVSADRRRIPVKIMSKVFVGSFVGELIASENGVRL